jgi:hypothetical protein
MGSSERWFAVEAVAGNRPRHFGPFRPVKFSHFPLREAFARHDELCLTEEASMLQHAAGNQRVRRFSYLNTSMPE